MQAPGGINALLGPTTHLNVLLAGCSLRGWNRYYSQNADNVSEMLPLNFHKY